MVLKNKLTPTEEQTLCDITVLKTESALRNSNTHLIRRSATVDRFMCRSDFIGNTIFNSNSLSTTQQPLRKSSKVKYTRFKIFLIYKILRFMMRAICLSQSLKIPENHAVLLVLLTFIWKKITIYFNYLTMKCLGNKSNIKKSFPANYSNKINEGQAQL